MLTFWENFILSLIPGILAGLASQGVVPPASVLAVLKVIDLALDAVPGVDPPPPTTPAAH